MSHLKTQSQKDKSHMNTHQMLYKFHNEPNYGEIAKNVAEFAKTHPYSEIVAYIDALPFTPKMSMLTSPKPLKIFGRDLIEQSAIDQMNTCLSIPVAIRGALMPDAHLGYAMPIGGVIELDNAISPSFVGYDISCMVMLTIFDLSHEKFMANRLQYAQILKSVTRFGRDTFPEGSRQHYVMSDSRWNETNILRGLKDLAQQQLGTSGGGNHFADLVLLANDRVGLLTHSGSRGAGHKFATHYTKVAKEYTDKIATNVSKGYEWFSIDSDEGQEYLIGMDLLGEYAEANHALIHLHFENESNLNSSGSIKNKHNFAWQEWNDPYFPNGIVNHRKGATPAYFGQLGLIPGSSGTPSYVVMGLGNTASLNSSSHGAGRVGSRKQAIEHHDKPEFEEHMIQEDILHFGLSPDETYQAYKPIAAVMQAQTQNVQVISKMYPKVVIMSGAESDDG